MRINSHSVNDTIKIGRRIASVLERSDIVCLFGSLGSGKTVLTKGIASGLGAEGNKIVSPSFVLIRAYPEARIALYHFDLYRLKVPQDILGLGYEEYLYGEGVSIIEWADRLGSLLPEEYLKVKLEVRGENERSIEFLPRGKRYEALVKELA